LISISNFNVPVASRECYKSVSLLGGVEGNVTSARRVAQAVSNVCASAMTSSEQCPIREERESHDQRRPLLARFVSYLCPTLDESLVPS